MHRAIWKQLKITKEEKGGKIVFEQSLPQDASVFDLDAHKGSDGKYIFGIKSPGGHVITAIGSKYEAEDTPESVTGTAEITRLLIRGWEEFTATEINKEELLARVEELKRYDDPNDIKLAIWLECLLEKWFKEKGD